jgi:asparagine synthase (glutamine-hydrolysing)
MCGICGVINFSRKPVREEEINIMMLRMKHRGPDDRGKFIENHIGLGFVRLSILDLTSNGNQPMVNENNSDVIVYNGEIYNYVELREELRKKGYIFKSNSDTEVVLKSYEEWGEGCLNKFNGMWSLLIYKKDKNEIFCARDRYGIKPFYYYCNHNEFIFASEIPPILDIYKQKPSENNQVIFNYLLFNRTDYSDQTFFKEIKKLQHGHKLNIDLNENNPQPEIKRWYNLRNKVINSEKFNDFDEYRNLLQSAVALRLRSDVPIGVCLSGGLDSSSIVSILTKKHGYKDLNTFSAIYGLGKRGDESEFIHEYKNIISNMHFVYPDAFSLYNDLCRFIYSHAEPIPTTSPYAQYKVMEIAKENVVVTIDGQGADETLAGYHYFFGYYFKGLLKQMKLIKLLDELFSYFRNHKSLYGFKSFLYLLLPDFFKTQVRVREKGYLYDEFIRMNEENQEVSGKLYNSKNLNDALMDHFEYKLEHLLKWEDRNSMCFSLEARVPFLDYRLVEKTLSTSEALKINQGTTKYILREAMKNILPIKIRNRRDKIGFMTPENEWLKEKKFTDLINNIINSTSFKKRNIIDPNKAKGLYFQFLNKETEISKEIWKWINLELWFRQYID